MYARETATAQVSLRDDRILAVTNRGIDPSADDVREIAEAMSALAPEGGWPVLWDARHVHEPHAEAWVSVLEAVQADVTALAIYVDDADSDKFLDESASVESFELPCRTFTEVGEAIEWLTTFLTPAEASIPS